MPPHISTVDALGVATIVLVNLLCLAGVFCVFYILYFRSQVRQGQSLALREFNAVWVVRILLIVLAVLWGLMELLRLPLLRHSGRIFASWKFEQQATLCRIYTVSSLGFLEPCFFLMALFLVQGSGWRMIVIVINKRLQTRVCSLVLSLGMLLPVQVLFMGFSVLSTPGTPLFELMAFLGFLTVLLCISVGEGILVVQPIADALAVRWVFDSLPTRTQDMTIESFAVPLSVFGTEEDNSPPAQELLLIKATESLDGDD